MAKKEDFLAEARARFALAEEAERELRDVQLDDLRAISGDQWPAGVKAMRDADGRPCLTTNRLPQFIRQVSNDARQNRPQIQVNPVDSDGDPETAEIIQGLIRHIEYDSNADQAYDCAYESAAQCGIGWIRLLTEYSDPLSFDQDIKIKRIRNPHSVLIDPNAKEADRSDMQWAFMVDFLTREEFETLYPQSEVAKGGQSGWELARQQAPQWMEGKGIRVCEYFEKTFKPGVLCLLDSGETVLKAQVPEGAVVVRERQTQIPTVTWSKITGTEILEQTEWPSQWIPLVPVLGSELEVDGKLILEGVIRHAKDSQKMLNVWVSAETEAIGLAPKSPWLVAEGQLEGYEKVWRTSNSKNHAYLTYKPTSSAGQPVPPPQRVFGEANVQALTNARLQAQDDLKSLVGIYDSALGARSNETSGLAIRARQNQASTAHYHLMDNLVRAMRQIGRIIVDLIPKIYDAQRVVRIVGDEGEQRLVTINAPTEDKGEMRIYDLGVGKYDVTVSSGPSYQTKRQEAVASMLQLAQAYPPITQIAGDLMVGAMDWPGAKAISQRLKKLLPPEVQDEQEKPQIPPQLQAQLAQSGQMVEQLTQALNDVQDKLDSKTLEIESKERIAAMQAQVELVKTWAQLDQKDAALAYQTEYQQLEQRLALLREGQPVMPGLEAMPQQTPTSQEPIEPYPAEPYEAEGGAPGMTPEFDATGLIPAQPYGQQAAFEPGPSMETP